MRQRCWLELLKDYDYTISHQPGKAHIIVDALSRKSTGNLAHIPVKTTFGVSRLARLYIDKIIRLHGVPVSIVYNRGPQFTS